MNCLRESELLEALARGCVGPELEAHVASCAECSELRTVAGALLDDRAAAMSDAPVPSSATMLWRVRTRHRQEAATAARRTLLIGQAATLFVAVTLVVVLFGRNAAAGLHTAWTSIGISTPLLVVLALWVVATPIAGWVVARAK